MHQNLFIGYILAINIIAYLLMCSDKVRAIKKKERISENTLFFAGLLLGAIGIYGGMKAPVYHKAAKLKFRLGVPVLIVLNIISVYFMESYFFLHLNIK